uniref:Uncharacterized protein n=1 Tax=Oryza barthii TaxID=65489 RepID=A0A0D3EJJ4_9ORYZ
MQVGGDNLNLELGMVEAQVAGGEDPAAGTPPETSTVKALRGVGFLTLVISVGVDGVLGVRNGRCRRWPSRVGEGRALGLRRAALGIGGYTVLANVPS